jgi:short-subunit dehydrogenase
MNNPRSILITGASSGIGHALALAYADTGVTLFLSGRDGPRLAAIVSACEEKNAVAKGEVIDVANRSAMEDWIADCDQHTPLDLVIANAGISGDGTGDAAETARRILSINVDGVFNTVLPAIDHMSPRGHGQIAIMSSLASFRGLPGTPAYAASKAAVRIWGEGLRPRLGGQGIKVSVICPGFVESRMTRNNPFPMPLMMTGERAAGIIRRGLMRNRARIAFPLRMYAAAWVTGVLPTALTDGLLKRTPAKE